MCELCKVPPEEQPECPRAAVVLLMRHVEGFPPVSKNDPIVIVDATKDKSLLVGKFIGGD